jgi:uncharacterized repeat protein (TIGR03803 family)
MGGGALSAKSILLAGAVLAVIGGTSPSAARTQWGQTFMYNFKGYPKDGEHPETFGNLAGGYNSLLYGTTMWGGNSPNCSSAGYNGCGTVFTVDTNADVHHHYPEKILYSFNGADGQFPWGTLWFDISNPQNIWGTTGGGGTLGGWGTVFELTPDKKGNYKEHFLYSFGGPNDGATPYGGVVQDRQGNVYGTTAGGGTESAGVIFEIDGGGNEYVLHSMNGTTDGYGPMGGLVIDGNANLYGVAYGAGDMNACNGSGCGTVFEVANGGKFSVLYRFKGGLDGQAPEGGLTIDGSGNLFGTTQYGGSQGGGTIFEITNKGKYKQLFSFGTGDSPLSAMWLDESGNLYGSTPSGGYYNEGYAFELDRKGNFTDMYDWGASNRGGAMYGPTGGPIVLNNIYYLAGTGGDGSTSCDSPPSVCGAVVMLTPK